LADHIEREAEIIGSIHFTIIICGNLESMNELKEIVKLYTGVNKC
jgi:hypothetical protein